MRRGGGVPWFCFDCTPRSPSSSSARSSSRWCWPVSQSQILGGSGDFSTHIEFGYTWVGLAGLAVVLTALAARRPRWDFGITLGLLALYIVQTALPAAKSSYPAIAALHPLNAMFLFALAAWYARRAWLAATASTSVGG